MSAEVALTCADVSPLLDAFVDAELPGQTLVAVARHLGACATCDEALRQLGALHEVVEEQARTHAEHLDLSGVWPALVPRLARTDARRVWRRRLRSAPIWGAAAALAAGVMLWLGSPGPEATRVALRPRPNQAFIDRIDTQGGRFELRRERKNGTTLIMVSAPVGELR